MSQELTLQVGRIYRAKKPGKVSGGISGLVNDRYITWISSDGSEVQYDGPVVKIGSRYKKISREKFLAWASHDVSDELPEDKWAPWPPKKPEAA